MPKKYTLGQTRSPQNYALAGGKSPDTFTVDEHPYVCLPFSFDPKAFIEHLRVEESMWKAERFLKNLSLKRDTFRL